MDPGRLTVDVDLPRRSFRLRVALDVGAETLAVAGPSGAGKSSLLRVVAGLERPEAGRVAFDGTAWFDAGGRVDLPPERRSVGLVFQEYALFPHLTVARNVAYGGRDGVPGLLERLGIAHLAGARPAELSGGERQRVAIARALARRPAVLLLDEPMAALDPHTRDAVRGELRALLTSLRLPTLIVTHDFEDAATLADRVAVLEAGRIAQQGTPEDLVARPADAFVASLTGSNLVEGVARPGPSGLTEVALDGGGAAFSSDVLAGRVGVVVHPADITLGRATPEDSSLNHLRAPVASVVRIGTRVRVRVGPLVAEITAASLERLALAEGDVVTASFKATGTRLVPLGGPAVADPRAG